MARRDRATQGFPELSKVAFNFFQEEAKPWQKDMFEPVQVRQRYEFTTHGGLDDRALSETESIDEDTTLNLYLSRHSPTNQYQPDQQRRPYE